MTLGRSSSYVILAFGQDHAILL